MKLTQQYWTIPTSWHERPKNKGNEIIIKDNCTFSDCINIIEEFCRNLEYFHHYQIILSKRSSNEKPIRFKILIYTLDPNRKIEGKCNVIGWENEIPPVIPCIFYIYNNEEKDKWISCFDFNVINL